MGYDSIIAGILIYQPLGIALLSLIILLVLPKNSLY